MGRIATVIIAFLGSIFLARELGPEGYGLFYLFMAIVGIADNPVTGWARACRKRFTEVDFPEDEAIGSLLIGIAIVSATVFVGTRVGAPVIADFAGNQNAWFLFSILFVAKVTFSSLIQVLNGTPRFGASSWVIAIRDTVRVLLQVTLVIIGLGVAGMVWGISLASLVLAPIIVYLIGVKPSLPSKRSVLEVWEFARSSIPLGIVGTAKGRMDVVLLGALVGSAPVGNYEIALKMTMPAMFLASVASSGLVGRVSDLNSRDEGIEDDVRNNLGFASLLSIPLFFGAVTIGGPVVVTIYGNEFVQAKSFIAGLALFRLIASQRRILGATINGLDRPDLNLRVSTSVFVLNVGLGVVLLYAIGPIGVVVATVASAAVGYALRAYLMRSLLPSLTLVPNSLVHQVGSALVMAAVVYATREAWSLQNWMVVASIVGLGIAIYFGTLTILSRPFRTTVRGIVKDAKPARLGGER